MTTGEEPVQGGALVTIPQDVSAALKAAGIKKPTLPQYQRLVELAGGDPGQVISYIEANRSTLKDQLKNAGK